METFRYSLISGMHIDLGHQADITALALEEHVIVCGHGTPGWYCSTWLLSDRFFAEYPESA